MEYKAPKFFKNGHVQSIYPALFRKTDSRFLESERIETDDKDFLDIEWANCNNARLIIVSHGLEGSAKSPYGLGVATKANANGWDALLWNFRSCSNEMNRLKRYYHSGATDDLERVIEHAIKTGRYKEIVLVGFSLGGNLTLVYAGEQGKNMPKIITKAIAFSAPCDLYGSARELTKFTNKLYIVRFLRKLKKKIRIKHKLYPELDIKGLEKIKNLSQFADRFTGPLHGFMDSKQYFKKCSSKYLIPYIRIPTLIVSALDDPFLSESCYPYDEAANNPFVTLETPKHGGHMGFISFGKEGYWSEERLMKFINKKP